MKNTRQPTEKQRKAQRLYDKWLVRADRFSGKACDAGDNGPEMFRNFGKGSATAKCATELRQAFGLK